LVNFNNLIQWAAAAAGYLSFQNRVHFLVLDSSEKQSDVLYPALFLWKIKWKMAFMRTGITVPV